MIGIGIDRDAVQGSWQNSRPPCVADRDLDRSGSVSIAGSGSIGLGLGSNGNSNSSHRGLIIMIIGYIYISDNEQIAR